MCRFLALVLNIRQACKRSDLFHRNVSVEEKNTALTPGACTIEIFMAIIYGFL